MSNNAFITGLSEAGVNNSSLTFDGASANFTMAQRLECNFSDASSELFRSHFDHPVSGATVAVFLEPCHMLKLVRNSLADKKSLFDADNEIINFDFITRLNKLQDSETLHLGNRPRATHMAWHKRTRSIPTGGKAKRCGT